jgi:polar amino acid transport system substrate-binding protein
MQGEREVNRLLHIILLLAAVSVVSGACAPSAVEQAQAPAETGTLAKLQLTKYALLASYNEPPHDWFDSTEGKWKGVDNDIVEYILPRLGVESWDFIVADWSALIPGLQSGRWDLMSVGMAITETRTEEINFSEPVYQYGIGLLVQAGNPGNVGGQSSWSGLKIGTILGSSGPDEIKAGGGEPVNYKQYADMMADVKAGRIDAAIGDELTLGYALIVSPDPALEVIHEYDGKAIYLTGIGFRMEDVALLEAFNAEIVKMKEDGTLMAILTKYGLGEANFVE